MCRSFSKSSSAGVSSLPELKAVPLLNADSQYADEHQEATKLAGQATIEPNMEDNQYISPENSDAEVELISLGLISKASLVDRSRRQDSQRSVWSCLKMSLGTRGGQWLIEISTF